MTGRCSRSRSGTVDGFDIGVRYTAHTPALSSYAARSSLDVTVHVSVACVVRLYGKGTHLKKDKK